MPKPRQCGKEGHGQVCVDCDKQDALIARYRDAEPKLYCLFRCEPYEGDDLLGVYSTIELAKAALPKLRQDMWVDDRSGWPGDVAHHGVYEIHQWLLNEPIQ